MFPLLFFDLLRRARPGLWDYILVEAIDLLISLEGVGCRSLIGECGVVPDLFYGKRKERKKEEGRVARSLSPFLSQDSGVI